MKEVVSLLVIMVFSYTLNAQQNLQPKYEINCVKKNPEYKSCNKYQKDFLIYMDLLQNVHPLSMQRSEENDLVISTILPVLSKCQSSIDFEIILQRIASKYKDSHTFIEPLKNDKIYPIKVKYFGNDCFIIKIDQQNNDFIGKQIESINNIPLLAIADTFANVLGCENTIKLNIIVSYFISNTDYMQKLGLTNKNTLTIRTTDGFTVDLLPESKDDVIWVEENNYKLHPVTREDKSKLFFYEIYEDAGICYFQFNKFYDRATYNYFVNEQLSSMQKILKKDEIHNNSNQLPLFSDFLVQMFSDIDKKNIKTLVVDLRNNGGGNSALGNQLLSCLYHSKDLNNDIMVSLRISKFYKQHYRKTSKQLENIYKKKFKEDLKDTIYNSNIFDNDNEEEISLSSYFPNPKIKNLFSGDVIFIQGNRSFSSAVDLLTKIHDNNLYLTIGEETSQKPTSFGDMLCFELPNTGIRGGISCKIFHRPDSTLDDEPTLYPDIEIINSYSDWYNGTDKIWDYIILNFSVKNEQ